MIAVIQCAARKRSDAGHMRTTDGKPVQFVANPQAAPTSPDFIFARPDDPSDWGRSWRELLLTYNEDPDNNPLDLFPAYLLYENKTYSRLVDRLGAKRVFILSAGWGVIRADFLTPYYDITFSSMAAEYQRRRKRDRYNDFRSIPSDIDEEILFFGGKDYLNLFCLLTGDLRVKRTVFYNSAEQPIAAGCTLKRFKTTTRTNWHYECVNACLQDNVDAK